MLSVLIEGSLSGTPTRRTASNGNDFVTAQMRTAGEDGETVWCSLIAFHAEAVEKLLELGTGDAAAVAGFATVTTWQKGETLRAGLRVTVTRVLTVYDAGKRRKASAERGRSEDDQRAGGGR